MLDIGCQRSCRQALNTMVKAPPTARFENRFPARRGAHRGRACGTARAHPSCCRRLRSVQGRRRQAHHPPHARTAASRGGAAVASESRRYGRSPGEAQVRTYIDQSRGSRNSDRRLHAADHEMKRPVRPARLGDRAEARPPGRHHRPGTPSRAAGRHRGRVQGARQEPRAAPMPERTLVVRAVSTARGTVPGQGNEGGG